VDSAPPSRACSQQAYRWASAKLLRLPWRTRRRWSRDTPRSVAAAEMPLMRIPRRRLPVPVVGTRSILVEKRITSISIGKSILRFFGLLKFPKMGVCSYLDSTRPRLAGN
jgi:hypothetical protein